MLNSLTEFPNPGSEAIIIATAQEVRVTQHCADGTLLVTGKNVTGKRVAIGDLIPRLQTRASDVLRRPYYSRGRG